MIALELMNKFHLNVDGIIHVGSNTSHALENYRNSGAAVCLYVEPSSLAFRELERNIVGLAGHIAVRAICSNVSGEVVELNVADNGGQPPVAFQIGERAVRFPLVKDSGSESLTSQTLDEIIQAAAPDAHLNLLVIDAQGAELRVLQGARGLLAQLDGIFVDVSEVPISEGGCPGEDIANFLRPFDFKMKWMEISTQPDGHAFFLRGRDRPLPPASSPNLALNKIACQSSLSVWSKPADAQGGNNGVRTGGFGFCTEKELDPWWQVDLGHTQKITEVRVYNRMDVCSERAFQLTIWVSVDGMRWRQIHDQAGRRFGGTDGRPLRVFPRHTAARFVRLQLRDTQYLHLDEVEIY